MYNWSLDELYVSFADEAYTSDMLGLEASITDLVNFTNEHCKSEPDSYAKEIIAQYIAKREALEKYLKLLDFASLSIAANCDDDVAMKMQDRVYMILNELSAPETVFSYYLAAVDNWGEIIQTPELVEHSFVLNETREFAKHLLSEREEVLLARLRTTGSDAWSLLKDQLTATLMVTARENGEEKQMPLMVARNLANDANAGVRKDAYIGELKAYEKIDKQSAAALNAIKGEAITVAKARGYKSVLDMTLLRSRMDEEILQAMLGAMKDSLPDFERYFLHKAKLLGHDGALPFYDIFAPVGQINRKYTYEEACEVVFDVYGAFSLNMEAYARHAVQHNWIDVYPRESKTGGAFCASLNDIRETRILLNFGGEYGDVSTIAHELGHGYHDHCMKSEKHLNREYSMPIAETASTFAETLLAQRELETANDNERLFILEKSITEAAQVIVDIYSRFLFESEVIDRRPEGVLSVGELKDAMLRAQKAAYLNGLDHDKLHPYMWVCKSHYYSAGYNFYNFPYAYGLLFAKGLYAQYEQDKTGFPDKYRKMLSRTGKANLAEVAASMDIDARDRNFWKSSLDLIKKDIDAFCAM
ncbi:MAG: M3 family oligoendopeptidase [Clostridiales bacterium]|jgi:pepF/M3 family oligoendopeptidase|nr:M3 family oligoendopeptidase [Clostridiales bacterium]